MTDAFSQVHRYPETRRSNIDPSIDMSSDTPSDAELKVAAAKQAAEQAALPYKWTQTIAELDVSVPVPPGTRARDLVVEIKSLSIKVGLKGKEPILEVYLTIFPAFDATDIEPVLSYGFKRFWIIDSNVFLGFFSQARHN